MHTDPPGFAYTSEVRWTDRVFRFSPAYLEFLLRKPLPLPNTRLLYATLTGDPSTWVGARLAAVRWLTPPKDIAALVTAANRAEFLAELYHFGTTPRAFKAELRLLEKGEYDAILRTVADAREISRGAVSVGERPVVVDLTLPPGTLCEWTVRRR